MTSHGVLQRRAVAGSEIEYVTVRGGDHLLPLRHPSSMARTAADDARRHLIAAPPTAVTVFAGATR